MRVTINLTLSLLLVANAAAAVPFSVAFKPPGLASPDVATTRSEWALVLLRHPKTSMDMAWPTGAEGSNVTLERMRAHYLEDKGIETDAIELPGSDQFEALDFGLDFKSENDWSSIYLEGNIELQASSALAYLQPYADGTCTSMVLNQQEAADQPARTWAMCPPGDQAVAAMRPTGSNATMPFRLKSTNTQVVEWHNAQVQCDGHCPQGGRREQVWQPLAANVSVARETRVFERLTGPGDASVVGEGEAVVVLLGARSLNLSINGWLRLPLAEGSACEGCPKPTGNTLQATGELELKNLRMGSAGKLAASLDGDYESIRFDEASIDPALLQDKGVVAAAAVVAVGSLYALIKALIGFTRVHPTRAQENPRRKAIQEFIAEHPGAGFREVARGTGISTGVLRRHLEILKATGHVHDIRHGRSLRFFPGVCPSITNAREIILLREPALAQLYALVEQNPWLSQGEIVDQATREFAYSRATTQHRLARLINGGLLDVRKKGRFLLYATKTASSQIAGLG